MKSSDNGEQCEEKESNRRDRTSLLIISSHVADPPPLPLRVYQTIRASTLLLPRFSLFALSLVLRPTPFLYIRFSFDCCSLFHDVFLRRKHILVARERKSPLRSASRWEKFPRWRRVVEPPMMTFCHPMNLCNLDQSCLDNL